MNLNLNADTLDVVIDQATFALVGRYQDMLSFQKLRVYQRSIEFLAVAIEIIGELPKGHAELADQLLRAAQSQLATSPRVPAVARAWIRLASTRTHARTLGIDLLEGIVAMLTKMT